MREKDGAEAASKKETERKRKRIKSRQQRLVVGLLDSTFSFFPPCNPSLCPDSSLLSARRRRRRTPTCLFLQFAHYVEDRQLDFLGYVVRLPYKCKAPVERDRAPICRDQRAPPQMRRRKWRGPPTPASCNSFFPYLFEFLLSLMDHRTDALAT